MVSDRPKLAKNASFADDAYARTVLPMREVGTHKWEVGGLIVIAGSPSLTGAAYLASRSAGRAGAGIVYLAAGRGVLSMLAGAMPEVAHIMLPETDAPGSAKRAVERIEPYLEKAKAVVIGPGLGDDELTDHFLGALFGFGHKISSAGAHIGFGSPSTMGANDAAKDAVLFRNEDIRIVIDADGLNWMSHQEEWWKHLPAGRCVLTPHPGEMSRLTGLETEKIVADPQGVAREYAAIWNQVVVIKTGFAAASDGERTIVAEDAPVSLATAGSGDVFAGMIGAFLAQGLAPLDAAGLALFSGARGARHVEKQFGANGVLATDLPDAIASQLSVLSE